MLNIETAKSNDKWVVAKTIQIKDSKENYWIISKDFSLENVDCNKVNCDSIIQSHVLGPFVKTTFDRELKEKDISLTLEK